MRRWIGSPRSKAEEPIQPAVPAMPDGGSSQKAVGLLAGGLAVVHLFSGRLCFLDVLPHVDVITAQLG